MGNARSSARFRGITLNNGRVLVKEMPPYVVKKSNVHVSRATVLARGPVFNRRPEQEVYETSDVVILPDDSGKGKPIVLEDEEYIIFKQSDIIAKIELEKEKHEIVNNEIPRNFRGIDKSSNGPVNIATGAAAYSVAAAALLAQDRGGYDVDCDVGGDDGGGCDGGGDD